MMANFFDQFDAPATGTSAPANFFDQFDMPSPSPGQPAQGAAAPQVPSYDAMGNPTGMTEDVRAPATMPYGEQMANVGHAADNVVRTLANGVPFMDRFAAGMGALTGIGGKFGDYSGNLANERARDKAIEAAAPVASKVGNAVGGTAAAVATLPASAFGIGGSLITKMLRSGATGGALGGLSGASETPDLTNVGETAYNAAKSAGVGAGLGALVPVAGATIGKAYRAAAPFFASRPDGMSRITWGLLGNAIGPRTGARLAELGPEAVLADTSPSALGLAQGVAAKPGPGHDALVEALMNRNGATNTRLNQSVNDTLGPAINPSAIDAQFQQVQRNSSPLYEQAINSTPHVDITPVQQGLENTRLYAKGTDAARLDQAAELLRAPGRINGQVIPEYDPRALHRAKMELDAQIARTEGQTGSAAATATRDLVGVRSDLNNALETQVPGYADANLSYGAAARAREALGEGQKVLSPTIWPHDQAAAFDALPIEGQAAYRHGARAAVEQAVGNRTNDLQALRNIIKDESDWNRSKLAKAFDPQSVDSLANKIDAEQTFRDTYGKVVQGSQTAQRVGASKMIEEATRPNEFLVPKSATMTGLIGHALEGATRKGFDLASRSAGDRIRNELAQALIARGPQASSRADRLARGLADRDFMANRINGAISNPATLAALLAARGGGRPRPSEQP